MNKNIVIPKNDVFFYGISLNARDADVRGDIFSNIIMKYLTTLKPVSSKLYRNTDNAKYEYSYTFVPSKPLSWRVIKNRRVVEDIENLTDGKYCLNYYDDNGNDVKRVIFNNHHRWIKTNYYNSIYGENLICSLIPKELNAETVILQYITGDPYPVTLRPCPTASNSEVLSKVLERTPSPEVTALTNYGLLYFACEETLNIFSQILKEEEEKYKEAHKPPVFNTKEDVAGGFCFNVDNFDTTKSLESRFDLSEAQELTDEETQPESFVVDNEPNSSEESAFDEYTEVPAEITEPLSESEVSVEVPSSEEYSIDEQIALAIKMISETTSIEIDKDMVMSETSDNASVESDDIVIADNSDIADLDSTLLIIPEESESAASVVAEDTVVDDVLIEDDTEISEILNDIDETISADMVKDIPDEPAVLFDEPDELAESTYTTDPDSADLLKMDDDAIDDYVSSLIDSLLQGAQSTVNEYNLEKDDAFTAGNAELDSRAEVHSDLLSDLVEENSADTVIESNGAEYHYYGELNDEGKRTGRGRTLMSDGKLAYDGEYLNDMRHGKGSFYYKDGSLCFYGNWQENMRNGFGIGINSETGIIHTGNWNENKPEGIGVRFDKDGNFMYLDSASHRTNGGIRIVGFGENSIIVEIWNEKTLKIVKKEISLEDMIS